MRHAIAVVSGVICRGGSYIRYEQPPYVVDAHTYIMNCFCLAISGMCISIGEGNSFWNLEARVRARLQVEIGDSALVAIHIQNLCPLTSTRPKVRELIDSQVKSNKLMLYMKGTPNAPQCGFSMQVCSLTYNVFSHNHPSILLI